MNAIDRFTKSKAKYSLLGMQLINILIFGHTHRAYIDIENKVVNIGAWIEDMLVPKWLEEEYGRDKACSDWYVEINNGDHKLLPYWIHPKTREAQKHDESMKSNKEEQKENIVSKTASQVGMS
ncbi:MAG TPA: hypothetical protein VIR31_05000 [Nitrososphaeraceae archaeon]